MTEVFGLELVESSNVLLLDKGIIIECTNALILEEYKDGVYLKILLPA